MALLHWWHNHDAYDPPYVEPDVPDPQPGRMHCMVTVRHRLALYGLFVCNDQFVWCYGADCERPVQDPALVQALWVRYPMP